MGPVNRQDVQNIVEIARNRIMERAVTKQDMAVMMESIRNLTNMHQQSQQILKQGEYQRSQLTRRAVALETRLGTVENELKTVQYLLGKLAEQKPQQIIMPVRPEQPATPEPTPDYAYRPN